MSDRSEYKVEVVIVYGDDEFIPPGELDGKTQLEPAVDAMLDRFEKFYIETLKNTKLSGFERAAIKTFLHWSMFTDSQPDATSPTAG